MAEAFIATQEEDFCFPFLSCQIPSSSFSLCPTVFFISQAHENKLCLTDCCHVVNVFTLCYGGDILSNGVVFFIFIGTFKVDSNKKNYKAQK